MDENLESKASHHCSKSAVMIGGVSTKRALLWHHYHSVLLEIELWGCVPCIMERGINGIVRYCPVLYIE